MGSSSWHNYIAVAQPYPHDNSLLEKESNSGATGHMSYSKLLSSTVLLPPMHKKQLTQTITMTVIEGITNEKCTKMM